MLPDLNPACTLRLPDLPAAALPLLAVHPAGGDALLAVLQRAHHTAGIDGQLIDLDWRIILL